MDHSNIMGGDDESADSFCQDDKKNHLKEDNEDKIDD
jgi:hypothetical protein